MRVTSLILVVTICILSAGAVAQEKPPSFPAPLTGTIDAASLKFALEQRATPPIPESAFFSTAMKDDSRREPSSSSRDWPLSGDLNDTSPFLYGDTYVIHVFVKDGGGSWNTSSYNPFEYTRNTQAGMVKTATEWIQNKAPGSVSVSFNTSNTSTYYYYNATISGTIGEASGCDTWMTEDVPKAIGFSDYDGDGWVIDDMLEYLRTLSGGGWENVIAVYHFNHDGRSFACSDNSVTACFTKNSISGFTIGSAPRTYAHEMMHLYGASDEYLDGFISGSCSHGDCNTNYYNDWLTPVYKNGNCASCGYEGSCLMRWMLDNLLNAGVSLCTDTKEHVGWMDSDMDGKADLEESAPWAEITTRPPYQRIDSTFTAAGTAYVAYRWTHIEAVEYSMDGGAWKNAEPADGTFGSFQEGYLIEDTLHSDGNHTVRVRAKTANGTYQESPPAQFAVRVDRSGPAAPGFWSGTHSDTTRYYGERVCGFSWKEPFDSSGVSGYSYQFNQNPSTIPSATVNTTTKFADGTAAGTGRWYMHVRAVDPLGNWGATAHFKAKVDITPPTAPVITSSTHYPSYYSNKTTASLSWMSTDAHSGVDGYNSIATLNQSPTTVVPTYTRSTDDSTDVDVPTTADGAYYFHVRAVDAVGNWGPTAHYKLLVDMTPPRITVSCGTHPNPAAWYIADEANISFKEIVSDLSGIVGYGYTRTLDDSTVVPPDTVNTNASSVDIPDLESGTHYFAVQARDNAGNWGSAIPGAAGIARVTIRVDQTKPDTVTNLNSPSHGNAIGKWDCVQSADRTIDVAWTKAVDAHSGVGGYAYVWNQSATAGPIRYQRLDSTATSVSSGLLSDADNYYFHIRTVDKVGNWDEHFATLGPFTIRTTPPSPPEPYAATTGDAAITMRWHPVSGVPDPTYNLYRRDEDGTYGSAVATAIEDTTYTESWPTVKNGDIYYYAVTTVDSCGMESEFSYESMAAPEYTTPNTGRHWHLSDLVNNSKGGIRGAAPQYSMHGTVTVSPNDTIVIDAGHSLMSQDDSGTKKLSVKGTLIADGTAASPIVFTAAAKAGSWNGITLESPGGVSLMDHCTVQYAATGITWGGGSPKVTNCVVESMSGGGIVVSPAPAMMCVIDTNIVRQCGGTGISIFASPNSTSRAAKNTVYTCAVGISYDMNVALPAPASLTIDNNMVRNQTGNGINAGNGAANTFVTNNTVLENQNGIVFDGEGWLIAAPVVSGNNVSGNRTAGIHTAMQSAPIVQNNKIVQNGWAGCFSKTNAHPAYSGNTITGSLYGVMVQNSPAAVPDLGNPGPGSAGMNRLDGHKFQWIWNGGGVAMNAKNNYWGSAQANPALVIGGPSAVLWNPVWNVPNQPPAITLLTPNGGTAVDNVVVTWNDGHMDPDDAKINLYHDNNGAGLDGAQIENASNLSQQSATNQFTWDTRLIPAGTYFVYALISDNSATRSSYAPGSVTIQHPDISVTPASLAETLAPDATRLDTLTIHNAGTATLHAHLHSSAAWLVLTDTTKTVSPSTNALATFTWDASGLMDGTVDSCRIDVTSDDHSDSLVTIGAALHVETGAVALSAAALAFGGVAVDSTRTDTLEVYNTGSADLYVTGAVTETPFAVVDATFPDTLAHGDTLILSVGYTPTAAGADAGTLTLSTSDGSDPEVDLTGTGLAGTVRLAEASHAFGTLAVGSSAAWEVHVANDGTAGLVISSAVFDSTGFFLESPRLAASIPAGDSIRLVIGFNPAEARAYVDTLRLATNDAGAAEVALRLTGTGAVPEAELSAASIAFGGVRAGESATDSLWVRNTGDDTLTVVSAGASAPFSFVSPSLPALVLAGDSLKLSTRYSPTGADSSSDTLFVETDALTTPVLAAGLSGWGIAPQIAVLDPVLDFGAVHADSSDTLFFRVRNTGTAELSVSSLSLSFGDHFDLVPHSMPALLGPGDTLSFGGIFTPSPVGAYTDTASVTCDDPDNPVAKVRFVAEAVSPEAGIFRVTTAGGDVFETSLLPGGFDFGASALGEKRREVFRLRNSGGYPLKLNSLSASPVRFALDDTLSLPLTIAPGGFQAIAVSYRTDSLVSHGGHLYIGTNDRETPMISVPLAGHGAEAVAGLSPGAVDEVVFEGESSEILVSLMNTGENYYMYLIREREASTALAAAHLAAPADALSVATADWKQSQLDAARTPGGPYARSASPPSSRAPLSDEVAWLTAVDSLGVVPGRDTIDAAVSIDASPVAAGVYDAELLVLTDNADMDTTIIPVRMRVPRMRYADHTAAFRATVTDEGAFGFYDVAQSLSYGSGFVYPASGGQNLLFHGSLWVGKDTLHVSDESYGYDFEVLAGGELTIEGTDPRRSLARFTDAQAPSGLHVEVGQECLSHADPAHDDFLVVKYTIKNVSGAALSHVYAGLWLDWDVGLYSNNRGRFNHEHETGYMWNSVQPGLPYAGITVLSPASCTSFHLVYNPTYQYPYGTIRDKDKYRFMSDGVVDTATAVTQDWSMVMSAGPFNVAAGDSVRVSFAIVGGATLQALLDNAAEARDLMATPAEPMPVAARIALAQCYPNPFNPTTRIEFETPRPGPVQLTIFNVKGEVVARVVDKRLPAGRHTATWDGRTALGVPAASGVYFYRLSAEGAPSLTRKMVLLR